MLAIRHAQGSDPLSPVSIVVRAPVVGLDLRRRLAERGAFAGTRFIPLSRLVELLGASEMGAHAGERRPLTRAALGAAIRVALRDFPGILAGVSDHPATEESLVQTYRLVRPLEELDRRRLSSMSERARDVVAIIDAARRALSPSWYDLDDLVRTAAEQIQKGEADLSDVGPVILHLPEPPSSAQLLLLEALAKESEVTVLAGRLGDDAGDRASKALVEDLCRRGYELASVQAGSGAAESVSFSRAVGAPDVEEEVRTAVRMLMAHVESGGTLGRTAVAFPSGASEVYRNVIAELLSEAGVPWTGPATGSLGEIGPGKLVGDLVQLLVTAENPFERADVIRWLSSPALSPSSPLLQGLTSVSLGSEGVPAGAFDRCSRAAGVVGGIEEWRRRLGAYGRRETEGESSGAPAAVARDLLQVIDRLVLLAAEIVRATTWEAVAAWAVKVVEQVVVPGEERNRLREAVSELAPLDELEELASPVDGGWGARRWRLQLTSALGSVLSERGSSHGRFGAGPLVGPIGALAGIRSDLLIVLGVSEGILPARTPEDPLVTEFERHAVRVLTERERTEERDRRLTMTLLAGATASVATFPRVNRGASRPSYPSRWLSRDLFDGRVESVASFSAGVSAVAAGQAPPADTTDLELALITRAVNHGRGLSELLIAQLDDVGDRIAAGRERRRAPFTRFGGLVGPVSAGSDVIGTVMSATRMQSLASCPLQFMFDRLVRVEILPAPDRRHMIEPMARGSLIHSVLEDFVQATALGTEEFDGWDESSFVLLHEIAERHFEYYQSRGLTGKIVYWRMAKARILADLERFVAIEAVRLRMNGGRPVRTEVAFGYEDEAPPVVIKTRTSSEGPVREMQFRGKIDRIDVEPGGVVRVIDYKSGSANSYASIASEPLGSGSHLQLPIYARAARLIIGSGATSVIAEFRFCSSESGFKRVPVELTAELDRDLEGVLGVLGETIERGVLPPRPGNGDELQPANCRRCDFESVCRLDRSSLWQRASSDPSMADYVELVEGAKAS